MEFEVIGDHAGGRLESKEENFRQAFKKHTFRMSKKAPSKKHTQAEMQIEQVKSKKTKQTDQETREDMAGSSGLVIVEEPTAEIVQVSQEEWKKMTLKVQEMEKNFMTLKNQVTFADMKIKKDGEEHLGNAKLIAEALEKTNKKVKFNKEMQDEKAKLLAEALEKNKKLEESLELLESKLNILHECNDSVVPTDNTTRMMELEKETGRFTRAVEITIERAYEIEAVYGQTLPIGNSARKRGEGTLCSHQIFTFRQISKFERGSTKSQENMFNERNLQRIC